MDEGLDDLLNEALSDFDKPPIGVVQSREDENQLPSRRPLGKTTVKETPTGSVGGASGGEGIQAPREIFDQFFDKDISDKLQREWESAMKELVEDDPALASQLQNLSTTLDAATDAAQAANTSTQSASEDGEQAASGNPITLAPSSEAPSSQPNINKIMADTISGIERSADELRNMTSEEAEKKLLEEMKHLGLGGNMHGMMGEMGGFGALEGDFMSMMEGMMGNLLSKDVLYPTMKEISKVYPQWLEDNKGKVSEGELNRFEKQNKVIEKICKAFEEDNENDTKEVKSQKLNTMMNLVEQMQECGNPPRDLLERCGGGSSMDMGKFFGGHPGFDPSSFNPGDLNPENCNIM